MTTKTAVATQSPALHQGEPTGDLGRDHDARVGGAVRLRGARRVRPAPGRRVPRPREQGDGGARRAGGARRRRGDEADPPRRLVQTWHALFGAETAAEPPTRLIWEIEEVERGVATLTVTHELDGAPQTAAIVGGEHPEMGGGWSFVLSDLKTLLETGSSLGI